MIDEAHTLRARWIVPIAGPPIEHGFIEVAGGRIVRAGKIPRNQPFARGLTQDLGDVAILPGLVNAHTHLEFSDLQAPIGRPGGELADWIVEVVAARRESAASDSTPQSAIAQGIAEAAAAGTALIGEIATTPWPRTPSGVRGGPEIIAFAEVLGLTSERAAERFDRATDHVRDQAPRAGISPHAPYSTPPELIAKCVDFAIQRGCPLAMHVAESPAERELLQCGRGPFADNLAALGFDVAATFPWPERKPLHWLIDQLARAPSAMLVHGNDLQPDEISLIASEPSLSVVYCPRTHAFFGHAPHPVEQLIDAGVNVALGTDSRASNPDLQLWREVRWLLQHRQDLAPELVLRLATLGGARAMQRDACYGTLLPGRMAAFAVVKTTASDVPSLYADLARSDAASAEAPHN